MRIPWIIVGLLAGLAVGLSTAVVIAAPDDLNVPIGCVRFEPDKAPGHRVYFVCQK